MPGVSPGLMQQTEAESYHLSKINGWDFQSNFFFSEGMVSKNILYEYVDTTIKWLTENKIEYI